MSTHIHTPQPDPAHGLSELQCNMLIVLLDRYDRGLADQWGWGIPWKSFRPRQLTRSRSAIVSRALRRLEARGLIRRRNQINGDPWQECGPAGGFMPPTTHKRLTHVQITPEGETLARRLKAERDGQQTPQAQC